MPHISKLPMEELLTDLAAAAYEMGVCQVGIEVAPDVKTGRQIQERYNENEKVTKVIQNEILRRLK